MRAFYIEDGNLKDNELVNLNVTKSVFSHYGYEFSEDKSTERTIIFDAVRDPYRANLPQVSLDKPDYTDSSGDISYTIDKVVHVLTFVCGLASLGEAKLIVQAKKQRTN